MIILAFPQFPYAQSDAPRKETATYFELYPPRARVSYLRRCPCLSDLDGHRPTRLGLVCVSRSLKRSVHSVHWCGEPPPDPKGYPPSRGSTIPRAHREFVGVLPAGVLPAKQAARTSPRGDSPGGFTGAGIGPIPLSHARRFRGGPVSGAHSTPPTRCPGWTASVLCVLDEVASST